MILYIIKSSLCLAIVLGIYSKFLVNEKMYGFNRFYLLFGLIFSFTVPFLSNGIVIEPLSANQMLNSSAVQFINYEYISESPIAEQSAFNLQMLIKWIYVLIVSLLFTRFAANIINLTGKIFRSPRIWYKDIIVVLIRENILPYTFLHFVFLNQVSYERKEIEHELFTHELAHANEGHSFDIILIELCQIIFWFNPILLFYKKAIQLNHEFLADDSVIKKHHDTMAYQYLLINKSKTIVSNNLTSNFNFLITKKRLTMMTKNTSRLRALILGALTFPLFFILLLAFGKTGTAQTATNPETTKVEESDIYENVTFLFDDEDGSIRSVSYNDLSEEEKALIPPSSPPPPPPGSAISQEDDISLLPKGTTVYYNSKIDSYRISLPKDQNNGDTLPIPPKPPRPAVVPAPPSPPNPVLAVPTPPNPPSPEITVPTPPTPVVVVSPPPSPSVVVPSPPSPPTPVVAPSPPSPPNPVVVPASPSPPSPVIAPSPPLPPPPPPSPLELAKKLAKDDAIFKLNGKKISAKEALKLLKDMDNIDSVHVTKEDNNTTVMSITQNL